jgi:hypothetical protein
MEILQLLWSGHCLLANTPQLAIPLNYSTAISSKPPLQISTYNWTHCSTALGMDHTENTILLLSPSCQLQWNRVYRAVAQKWKLFIRLSRGHNGELHDLYSSPCRMIKSRRMRWTGHVARMGEKRNAYRILVGEPERKRPLWRPRRRWVKKLSWRDRMGWIGLIWLRVGAGGGLLWTRYWTFGFHKILESSWVAAQLAGFQEGLSSMSSWVIIYKIVKAERLPSLYQNSEINATTSQFSSSSFNSDKEARKVQNLSTKI